MSRAPASQRVVIFPASAVVSGGDARAAFDDEAMRALLATTREYTVVTLRRGPTYDDPSSKAIRWEHGRRNFALRAAGDLAVVLPVNDGSEVTGLGVFTGDQDQVKRLMEADPGVRSGAFVYEIHPTRGFPGDRLP